MRPLRILALSRYDRQGASSRLRLFQYRPTLEAAGHSITFAPFFDDRYLTAKYAGARVSPAAILTAYARRLGLMQRAVETADVLWVQKEALPGLPARVEAALTRTVPVVYDLDDAWHLRGAGGPVSALMARKVPAALAHARIAGVGNATLADFARDAGCRDVRIVPTAVDLTHYAVDPPPPGRPGIDRPLALGWIGSPSTVHDLARIAEPLRRVARAYPLTLTVCGAAQPDLHGVTVRSVPWSEAAERAVLGAIDVGVMPLADTGWNRGKCGFKLIQYMAAGRLAIGSPVGVNAEVLDHGRAGLLCTTEPEWEEALTRAVVDPVGAAALARAGRAQIERHYSTEVVGPRIVAMLEEAAQGHAYR